MNLTDSASASSVPLFKALSNEKRQTILRYLHRSRNATNWVIVKHTGIPQPQVTASLKQLQLVDLVHKERIGSQWIFSLNQDCWITVEHLVVN